MLRDRPDIKEKHPESNLMTEPAKRPNTVTTADDLLSAKAFYSNLSSLPLKSFPNPYGSLNRRSHQR